MIQQALPLSEVQGQRAWVSTEMVPFEIGQRPLFKTLKLVVLHYSLFYVGCQLSAVAASGWGSLPCALYSLVFSLRAL